MSLFRKATRKKLKLRMGLCGPPGSGKTMTALRIASAMGGRIAVIDTEHGAASKYAEPDPEDFDPEEHKPGLNVFDFAVIELSRFDPRNYIDAMNVAEKEKFDHIILDSISHAWTGLGGLLEQHSAATERSFSKNSYTAWKDVTPVHMAFIEAMLSSPCHIFATMRTKVETVLETNERGQQVPRRVGMAPIQREGMEYEFDVVGDMDHDHKLSITKTRCNKLDRAVISFPGPQIAETLNVWLGQGTAPAAPVYTLRQDFLDELNDVVEKCIAIGAYTPELLRGSLTKRGVARVEQLSAEDAGQLTRALQTVLDDAEDDQLREEVANAPPFVPVVGSGPSSAGTAEEEEEEEDEEDSTEEETGDVGMRADLDTVVADEPPNVQATSETEDTTEGDASFDPSAIEADPAHDFVIPDQPRREEPPPKPKAAPKKRKTVAVP